MPTKPKPLRLQLELTDAEAWTLARFFKRIGLTECKAAAQSDGEAYAMRDATGLLRRALAENGYAVP